MPELENGYTRIANELLEAIILGDFSKRELCIILAVIRKTYGYQKKTDRISLSQLQELTGIDKAHISRTLKKLTVKNVILAKVIHSQKQIGLNKDYTNWQLNVAKRATMELPKEQPQIDSGVAKRAIGGLPKEQRKGCQKSNERVAKRATTKEMGLKKYKEKDLKQKTLANDSYEFYRESFEKFWAMYPKKVGKAAVMKFWTKLKPDRDLTNKIINAIETIKIFKWDHTEQKFIPNPLTWLNQERWNDEPVDERFTRMQNTRTLSVPDRIAEANRLAEQRERMENEKVINPTGFLLDVQRH